MATRKNTDDRRARIEALRKAEQARERRNRFITIGLSAVVVAGLVGFGVYVIDKQSAKEEQREALAKQPIAAEKSWDAKKLGRTHVDKAVSYPQKPPVGGDHHQAWMNCDRNVYKEPIPNENAVHSLEHGAVWVTYNDKAPKDQVKKLEDRVKDTSYTMISPVQDQADPIMLTAWGKQVSVDSASDKRVTQFFEKYIQGPQTPEPGAACTSGVSGK
ncbi:DUF3105 domain-containing protein [Streptomyces amakusaensis]|uniref:Membrane protein n=2 Tax=Streptomyces TaxID=1883 RepID=A0A918ULX8_9ACTN|nr:DUF3105 domain-containing protein [Streptomyces inusitatus]GGZ21248.1 membrane protein [Streptomyces inusitatus]